MKNFLNYFSIDFSEPIKLVEPEDSKLKPIEEPTKEPAKESTEPLKVEEIKPQPNDIKELAIPVEEAPKENTEKLQSTELKQPIKQKPKTESSGKSKLNSPNGQVLLRSVSVKQNKHHRLSYVDSYSGSSSKLNTSHVFFSNSFKGFVAESTNFE